MRDEAVSPVVAFMLLLMVIVSFISVLNAYYIPSLKQQAEIEHLQSVEYSFRQISADVLQVLTVRQNISMNEPVQLGGGDVIFSPVKSSGYLEVNTSLQDQSLCTITVSLNTTPLPYLYSEINRTKISYRPVGNFWLNQGYTWEDGVLSVKKGSRTTYLDFTDESKALDVKNRYYSMLLPHVMVDIVQKNISSIQIDLVQVEYQKSRSISSNGAGTVYLDLLKSGSYDARMDPGETLSFDLLGTGYVFEQVNDSIHSGFFECSDDRVNNAYWDNETCTLKILESSDIKPPDLSLRRWNLTIHC